MRKILLTAIIMIMNTHTKAQSWVDKNEYPFEHRYIQLEGDKMHYVDEGEGDVILFVHGTPTWSFLYRNFIKALSRNYRSIAIDHIGFGLSEKPENFAGKPQDHARNLHEFIHKMNLRDITLVLHDFGGPVGISSAIENPDRIKRIVLFNSWLWETESNDDAKKIDKIINSAIGRFLYLQLNFSPRVLLKKTFHDKSNLPKHIHNQYIKPFPDKNSRLSLYRIAKSLVGSSYWYQYLWKQLSVIEDTPWLILWGMKDEFITPDFLDRWKERLPCAEVHTYECGHFVQEEKTEEAIEAMQRFLKAGKIKLPKKQGEPE